MKLKLCCVLVLAASFAASSVAQQAATPVSDPPATREDILRLFDVMHIREQMRNTMQLIMAQQKKLFRETIRQRVPAITEEQLNQMEAMTKDIVKDIPLDGILDDTIPIYQKHLSRADVDAMAGFYSSPTGQKILREQPEIAGESMRATAPRMQKAMGDIMDRIAAKAKEEAEKEKSAPAETPEQRKN